MSRKDAMGAPRHGLFAGLLDRRRMRAEARTVSPGPLPVIDVFGREVLPSRKDLRRRRKPKPVEVRVRVPSRWRKLRADEVHVVLGAEATLHVTPVAGAPAVYEASVEVVPTSYEKRAWSKREAKALAYPSRGRRRRLPHGRAYASRSKVGAVSG